MMEDWQEIKLGDILQLVRNGTSANQIGDRTDYPVTRIETISNGNIDYQKVGYVLSVNEKYKLQNGDILFSNINSVKHIGKLALYQNEQDLYHGMNLLLLRFKDEIDNTFIKYSLISKKKWFENNCSPAVSQASINQTTLKSLPLVIPKEKNEQAKIASILSTIDQAIEKTKALIAKNERIKTGLMQDLLTKGIDEHGNIRSEETHEFKDSPLGRIPVEWSIKPLSKVCDKIQDGTHFSPKTSKVGKYKYVTSKNIRFGYLDLENIEYVEEAEHRAIYGRCSVIYGDLLLTKDGANTGNAAINTIKEEISLLSSVAMIRGKKQILSNQYLLQYLLSQKGQKALKDRMSGNAITRITLEKINNTPIVLPSFNEQKRIVNILEGLDNSLEETKADLQKLQRIKTGLMQDLLTGKVSVDALEV